MRLNILTAISLISLVPAGLMAAPRSIVALKTELAPVLDGRVDEEQWSTAQVASDFLQQWPVQGGPCLGENRGPHPLHRGRSVYRCHLLRLGT